MMAHARVAATRGTCQRLQVGAVIARQGRPISTGYNGNVAGMPHCDHQVDPPPRNWAGDVLKENRLSESGCQTAMHAEANAIAFAARHGVGTEGADIFVTHQPCLACARLIINAGIWAVYYEHPYRIAEGVLMLQRADIAVYRYSAEDDSYIREA